MRLPRPTPLASLLFPRAGVAELADARDSKSREAQTSCGFDPHLRHHVFKHLRAGHVLRIRPWSSRLYGNCAGSRSELGSPRHSFGEIRLRDDRVTAVDAF